MKGTYQPKKKNQVSRTWILEQNEFEGWSESFVEKTGQGQSKAHSLGEKCCQKSREL
jgi:hypothetical protein